jgi:outer membrane immunogenic protein
MNSKMKKWMIMLAAILAIGKTSQAQYALGVGEKQANFGLGLSGWGIPIYAGLDFGVDKDISAGAQVSYRQYHDRWDKYEYRHSIVGILGNANYHFNHLLEIPKEFDVYAGLSLGFYIWNNPSNYYGNHASGLGLAAQAGARYYFKDNVAFHAELGIGNIFDSKIGITVKI